MLEADIQRDGINDDAAALRFYRELLDKFPQSPLVDEAQWAVANMYEKIGEKRLAALEWQRFLKLYPASERFVNAQYRLRLLEEFEPINTPESMAKLTQMILALSRNINSASAANEMALQLARLHFERREFPQAINYCKQALQEQDNSKTWQEALLLLGTCYFKLGEKECLRHATCNRQLVWFDSAMISLRPFTSAEDREMAARAGAISARIAFPPASPVFGASEIMPRTPTMLARIDSTLALFGDDSDFDYLRVWAAQTRKRRQAENAVAPSTSRKLLLAEVDSVENGRITDALKNCGARQFAVEKSCAIGVGGLVLAARRFRQCGAHDGAVTKLARQRSERRHRPIAAGEMVGAAKKL
jgi:tetratricopeptide (TPR) repeat protein